jgi:thioredoxin-like negative regulator of GroEL
MHSDSKSALDIAKRLAESGLYGESAEAFEKVFERQSRDPEALVALADVMAGMGQAESSLALLADSVDAADPSLPTLVKIADQLAGVGRLGESADFLIYSLACHPDNLELVERASKAVEALGRLGQLEWIRAGCVGDVPEE